LVSATYQNNFFVIMKGLFMLINTLNRSLCRPERQVYGGEGIASVCMNKEITAQVKDVWMCESDIAIVALSDGIFNFVWRRFTCRSMH
jgi:hypothetical protein